MKNIYTKLLTGCLTFVLSMVFSGCLSQPIEPTNYYILEYFPRLETFELKKENPLDFSIQILDTRIPDTYNRKQIIQRSIGPKITYLRSELWGVDLSNTIADITAKRSASYNIFSNITRDYTQLDIDYEVITDVLNIELLTAGNNFYARLNMDYIIRDPELRSQILIHRSRRLERVASADIELFIIKLNDMLLEEIDKFLGNLEEYVVSGSLPNQRETDPSYSTQLVDNGSLDEASGAILMPSITGNDNEPYYYVYDQDDELVESVRMGEPVVTEPGIYRIVYGSGPTDVKMEKKNIEVLPQYKTVIDPDWGCLAVEIITENREFVKLRYELFDEGTGRSYGNEISPLVDIGEDTTIWVLPTRRFKITVSGAPFNTYKNFSTHTVLENEHHTLTFVMGTDQEGNLTSMVGAGVIEGNITQFSTDRLKLYNAIYGTANINSSNTREKQLFETTITLSGQLDNKIVYDDEPIYYSLNSLLEISSTKNPDQAFRLSGDSFTLKNTLIYYFLWNFGLYGRLDGSTHFFPQYDYFLEDKNIIFYDEDDNEVSNYTGIKQTQTAPSFYPLLLKEGLGLNIRVFNKPEIQLNLRGGFGLRQEFYENVYEFDQTATIGSDPYEVYTAVEDVELLGIEASVLGTVRLPLDVTYTTTADIIFPFDEEQIYSIEWENLVNLILFKYLSLDYNVLIKNKGLPLEEDYFIFEHGLLVRFAYVVQ